MVSSTGLLEPGQSGGVGQPDIIKAGQAAEVIKMQMGGQHGNRLGSERVYHRSDVVLGGGPGINQQSFALADNEVGKIALIIARLAYGQDIVSDFVNHKPVVAERCESLIWRIASAEIFIAAG